MEGSLMKNFLKFAAALAVIAGAVVVIVKFGSKILNKLHGCKCCEEDCCCHYDTEEEEETAEETPAVEEAEETAEEAPVQADADSVTPEDFAD